MNIKTLVAVPALLLVGIAAAFLVAVTTQTATATAHEGDDSKEKTTAQNKDDNKRTESKDTKKESTDKKSASNVTYKYVAQPGDSYSKLARKAVQTYGLKHKVNLAGSQIVYAETNLTQEAGSPLLTLGQEVSISESAVKAWVEKAQKLSDVDKAKWNVYVSDVNFSTDNVGESR